MGLRHRMLAVCFRKSQAFALQLWCMLWGIEERICASGDNSRGKERKKRVEQSERKKNKERKKGTEKGPSLI